MNIHNCITKVLGTDNYDRKAERQIIKAIKIYHRGRTFDHIRALRLHNKNRKKYGCCFPPTITIGKNLYIAHAHGIHIGKTAIIGDNCKIYPNVLIVAAIKGDAKLRENGEKRWHAKIGNNCLLGAGSIICGRIEIGDDVLIAAGAIVTKDIPSHSIVMNTNEIRPKEKESANKKEMQ